MTLVEHVRAKLQEEDIDVSVQLTAYTGVAALNLGFGATTACSSFHIFPNAAWKNELQVETFRKLEQQWRSAVLLIVARSPSLAG